MTDTITVRRPHVPFGPKGVPEHQADAKYLRDAAGNIEFSRCMGSNLTATVVQLLTDAADAVEEEGADPEVFCPACLAGTTSSEHHTKCVELGIASDGEPANIFRARALLAELVEQGATPLPPDPAWTECTEHPGRENHCKSGWCGACWHCNERGVTVDEVQAYDEGVASGVRRASVPEPCVMTHTPPDDFAECKTHDLTFPLGGTCKYDGRVPLEVAQDEADEQRMRAVRAEHELAIARETPSLPDIEVVSARVHEAWMATKRAQGVESRPSEWGEEQMVPYADLSERAKDLDRGTVRSVYAAIEAAGATLPIDRERP